MELSIPRIALGVVESRLDDDLSIREKRGIQDFSLLAQDSNGDEVIGVSANDRISKFNNMMAAEGSQIKFLRNSSTSGMGWPLILTLVTSVIGIATIGIAVYCFKKKYGLSWNCCTEKEKEDKEDAISVIMTPMDL